MIVSALAGILVLAAVLAVFMTRHRETGSVIAGWITTKLLWIIKSIPRIPSMIRAGAAILWAVQRTPWEVPDV